jgi:hypothetical protein
MPWALAAALLLAVWLGAERARLGTKLDQASALLSRRDALLAQRDTLLQAQQRTLDALLTPGVELYQLTATGDPVPGVQLFWDRKRNRAIIHSFGVKPLPDDRAYQLWFIQDGKPVPSVTFRPAADGRAQVESIDVPSGAGVTRPPSPRNHLAGRPSRPRRSTWWASCPVHSLSLLVLVALCGSVPLAAQVPRSLARDRTEFAEWLRSAPTSPFAAIRTAAYRPRCHARTGRQ